MSVFSLRDTVLLLKTRFSARKARCVRRTDTTGVANLFTGLVFCADCGAKMYNHRGRNTKPDSREYSNDVYNCSTYCLTHERETQQCFSHSISARALTELMLETILTTAGYALSNRKNLSISCAASCRSGSRRTLRS